jgi:putative 4-mercaptohistidine N1-methyltranferase
MTNVYETSASLDMYLGLHYPQSGTSENVKPILNHNNAPNHGLRFPQRVANILAALEPHTTNNRALDIGCAVGGSSFELAKTFTSVDAFDFSSSFITTAKLMQQYPENVRFKVPIEAELYQEVAAVHEDDITSEIRSRVNFFVGDACRMDDMIQHEQLTTYDGIIMSNLLCRIPDPRACINSLQRLVNPGGIVVMVTPFSWLDEFTDRSQWLGGYVDPASNEAVHSKDVLKELMELNGFSQVYEEEMPLIIREHQRKYQYIISLATGWRKELNVSPE